MGNERPPPDASAPAIAVEAQQAVVLAAVEALDRVQQAALGIQIRQRRQRIIDTAGPALFLEDGQHQVMEAVRDFQVDIGGVPHHQKVVLRLNIALRTKE